MPPIVAPNFCESSHPVPPAGLASSLECCCVLPPETLPAHLASHVWRREAPPWSRARAGSPQSLVCYVSLLGWLVRSTSKLVTLQIRNFLS